MHLRLPKQLRLLFFHLEIAGNSVNLVSLPKFYIYFYVFELGLRDLLIVSSLILLR